MSLRKAFVSGVTWTTIGSIGRAIFQLLQVAILTRFLPKEAFGIVAMALFVIQFSNIFVDMGMTSAILHRQNATKAEYSSIYWFNIFISLILYTFLTLATPFISSFYNQPELRRIIPLLGFNIMILAAGRQHFTIMQKQFRFKVIALIDLVSFFIGLVTSVILALKNYGVYSLVISTLTSSLISNSLYLASNIRENKIYFHFSMRETKSFLKIGGYTAGSALLDFFSRETDVLIVGKMLGAKSLGVYSLSKQIVLKLFSIINPVILNVLSPLLASIQKQQEKLKTSFLDILKYLSYINIPVYLIIIVISKEILFYVYGKQYVDAYPVLSFLAFAYCIIALSNPVGSLQIATGRTDLGFKWTFIRVIVSPLVIYIGSTQNINMVAILYALLSFLFIVPLWIIQLKPMIHIKLLEYLRSFYKPLIYFVVATALVLWLNMSLFTLNSFFLDAIIKCSIAFISYIIYLFITDKKSVYQTYKMILFSVKGK